MNNYTESIQKLPRVSFEYLAEIVDLDRGHVLVGFLEQSREYRRRISRGTTNNDEDERSYTNSLVGTSDNETKEGGRDERRGASLWSKLLACCFPVSLLTSAVRGYTSSVVYHHCEIGFRTHYGAVEEGKETIVAVSVHNTEVFVEARAFDTNYRWTYVQCDRQSMVAMLILANQMRSLRLDMTKLSRSVLAPGPETENAEAVFCSELTMKLISLLPFPAAQLNRPNAQTPDDVIAIVNRKEFKPLIAVTTAPRAHLRRTVPDTIDLTDELNRAKAERRPVYFV